MQGWYWIRPGKNDGEAFGRKSSGLRCVLWPGIRGAGKHPRWHAPSSRRPAVTAEAAWGMLCFWRFFLCFFFFSDHPDLSSYRKGKVTGVVSGGDRLTCMRVPFQHFLHLWLLLHCPHSYFYAGKEISPHVGCLRNLVPPKVVWISRWILTEIRGTLFQIGCVSS